MPAPDRRSPSDKMIPNNPPCPKCGHAKRGHSRDGCMDTMDGTGNTPFCTCKVTYNQIK